MSPNYSKAFAIALLFSGAGTSVGAGILNCSGTATATEIAICNDDALSDLANMAADIGNAVGLEIGYSNLATPDDLYPRFDRLLRTLTVSDMDKLTTRRQEWQFDFDGANKILFINTADSPLQNMMVVFEADGSAGHVAAEHPYDAGRYSYRAVGNILEVTSSFAPALFIEKYRYQNGCWRLIGEDASWRDEDPDQRSINYLTGQAIFEYKDGSSITRSFDTRVICLGEDSYSYEIEFHDD